MKNLVYTFKLQPDWSLVNLLSSIEKFEGSWSLIEKREGQSLKHLKSIATIRSVGASTRIEGSAMTDDEVAVLIKMSDISKFTERDQQEVAGYFETLDNIAGSYSHIDISENNIKHLHKALLKHSQKDEWHKGNYKQHSNVVEATNADGSRHIIFHTADPGFATEEAMRNLIAWYNDDNKTHPLVKSAVFVYDFLSIHPFQDGNGRLSRLLASLLLLKNGYSWIRYISFEHEIESKKKEYYQVLIQCQRERPGEDVYAWVNFFLECLNNIQLLLLNKLEGGNKGSKMSPKEKMIYSFIENHPGCKSGEMASKLDIPLPTIKRMLGTMVTGKILIKHGIGKGTNYTV